MHLLLAADFSPCEHAWGLADANTHRRTHKPRALALVRSNACSCGLESPGEGSLWPRSRVSMFRGSVGKRVLAFASALS